jgi:hypothetical protein
MGNGNRSAKGIILHSHLFKESLVFPISSMLEIRNHFFHHLKSSAPKMSRMSSTNDNDPAMFTDTPVV